MHPTGIKVTVKLLLTKKIRAAEKWNDEGNVTTFLALMATSEPLDAKFRPTTPFEVEEKQRRRERVGATGLCRGVPSDRG